MGGLEPIKTGRKRVNVACEACQDLLNSFGQAITEVIALNRMHFQAVVEEDGDPHRFDLLIHEANERKQNAKYAYLLHRELHGCSLQYETNRDRP
jgi:hypothetical protein